MYAEFSSTRSSAWEIGLRFEQADRRTQEIVTWTPIVKDLMLAEVEPRIFASLLASIIYLVYRIAERSLGRGLLGLRGFRLPFVRQPLNAPRGMIRFIQASI